MIVEKLPTSLKDVFYFITASKDVLYFFGAIIIFVSSIITSKRVKRQIRLFLDEKKEKAYEKREKTYLTIFEYVHLYLTHPRSLEKLNDPVLQKKFVLAFRQAKSSFDSKIYNLVAEINQTCSNIRHYNEHGFEGNLAQHDVGSLTAQLMGLWSKVEEAVKPYIEVKT